MKKNILHGLLLGISTLLAVETASAQTTYTSNGSSGGLFSSPSTWNASLSPAEMMAAIQSGTNTFVIASGDSVIVDDSINVKGLTVDGILMFGAANDVNKTMIVDGPFSVGASGKAKVSDYIGTSTLRIKGNITSSGEINFRRGTGKAVNVVLTGTTQTVTVNTAKDKTMFNNFEVASGTVTAGSDLNIGGSFTLGLNAKFLAGATTLYIGGNFNKNATGADDFNCGTGTVVFNGHAVQTISCESSNIRFNHVTVNGGGFVVVANQTYFKGDFLITENSTVSSSVALLFYGNFTVDNGSTYDTNTSYTYFRRGYELVTVDDGNQLITINGEATFAGIECRCKADKAGVKTFRGSIVSTQYLNVYGSASLVDDATTYHHTFVGATVEGTIDLSSPMLITGGTLRKSSTAAVNGEFTLGAGDITTQSGEIYVKAGDRLIVQGNLTVESGAFVLSGAADGKQAEVVGTLSKTLSVQSGARFYLRGPNDNYPTGFGTITIDENSTTYYDSKFDQIIHGGEGVTYGNLYLDYCNKTFNGPTTIISRMPKGAA